MTDILTLEEAYKLLDVPNGSDLETVTKAYRELSKKHHPDLPNGNDEKQTAINQAYQLLSASFKQGQLASLELGQAVKVMEQVLVAQEEATKTNEKRWLVQQAATQVKESTAEYKRARSRAFRFPKFVAIGYAGFAGLFAWLGNDVFQGLYFDEATQGFLKITSVLLAGAAGVLQFMDQMQQASIDNFVERLNDEEFCASILWETSATYLPEGERFTVEKLLRYSKTIGMPFRYRKVFSLDLFPMDQAQRIKLALLKGVEHGMIEEVGKLPRRYKIVEQYRDFIESNGKGA